MTKNTQLTLLIMMARNQERFILQDSFGLLDINHERLIKVSIAVSTFANWHICLSIHFLFKAVIEILL